MSISRLAALRNAGTVALLLPLWAALAGGCASSQRAAFDQVVEPEQLARALTPQRPGNLVILDVRDPSAYGRGHVAGAVRVDIAQWKKWSLGGETGLAEPQVWYERIGSLGIKGNDAVVIYGDGAMTESSRLWFILQHFGVAHVAVVNGGYPAMKPLIDSKKIPISLNPVEPQLVDFHPSRPTAAEIALADREQVEKDVKLGTAQVLDARTRAEYLGRDARGNPRAGHIPGAINLPHKDLLDKNGKLKKPRRLAALFKKAGFEKGHPIITHCQSGGRASLAALAAERAGYGPVFNYYLSFGDWAAHASCPVVSASKP